MEIKKEALEPNCSEAHVNRPLTQHSWMERVKESAGNKERGKSQSAPTSGASKLSRAESGRELRSTEMKLPKEEENDHV